MEENGEKDEKDKKDEKEKIERRWSRRKCLDLLHTVGN